MTDGGGAVAAVQAVMGEGEALHRGPGGAVPPREAALGGECLTHARTRIHTRTREPGRAMDNSPAPNRSAQWGRPFGCVSCPQRGQPCPVDNDPAHRLTPMDGPSGFRSLTTGQAC